MVSRKKKKHRNTRGEAGQIRGAEKKNRKSKQDVKGICWALTPILVKQLTSNYVVSR